MNLEDAQAIANEVVAVLKPYTTRIEIVGSIRRRRPQVNDIDILLEPSLNVLGLGEAIGGLLGLIAKGEKIQRGNYKGIQIDIYFADVNSYETLKLIRTGSRESNIRLVSLAKRRGWHLYADGRGLANDKGRIVARTEEEIFAALNLQFLKPEQRDAEVYQSMWNTAKLIPKTKDD